jgi:carboxymethylenebutenolidase
MGLAACGGSGSDDYADRMAAEHEDDRPVAGAAGVGEPVAGVQEETVTYATVDGVDVTGFLARPAEGGEGAPGIVVIQEWWGLNDNIREMARKLAAQGYTALAVDLYRGKVAEDPDSARQLMQEAMGRDAALEENLRQAVGYLKETTGAPRIGVIGWCFGGGWSLRTALAAPDDVDATVIYYGRLITDPERLEALDSPVLGIFGSEDQGIPVETVREFEGALQALGKPVTIQVYEGADHAFANPSGTRYDEKAAADAWERTLAFFREHLAP